jgi:hypothetical protein
MHHTRIGTLGLLLLSALGCSETGDITPPPEAAESAFSSVEVAASASETFTSPLSGTPLPAGDVAFIALQPATEGIPARPALFRAAPGEEPNVLYAGDWLQNPLDLHVSADGEWIVVADSVHLDESGENAGGAILSFPIGGGEPIASAVGYVPRAVTVADSGEVYFSGSEPESGLPGVFVLAGDVVESVYLGAPLVDPSGIAVFGDGRIIVADTSFSDGDDSGTGSRGAVVLLQGGEASLFASGFETGYPAGLALTKDDAVLVVSGQGPDSSNIVFLFDTAQPDAEPKLETGFAAQQWSSGGLHRAHGENRFAWCDKAAEGGRIYSIEANLHQGKP